VTPRSEGGTTLEPTMALSEDGRTEAPIRPQGSDGCEGRVRGWRRVLMGEGRRAADGDRGDGRLAASRGITRRRGETLGERAHGREGEGRGPSALMYTSNRMAGGGLPNWLG
jgi:hypothetical protein